MRIWDISMEINANMPVWKGRDERRPIFTVTRNFENGKGARETRIDVDMHCGTHIDAPLHFVESGDTIENTTLQKLVRQVKVVDLTGVQDCIRVQDLRDLPISEGDFLLLKTVNSFGNDLEGDFVFIHEDAAAFLAEKKIAGVGIDALGVERDQPSHGTHLALLTKGIIIIEGLRLGEVDQGTYMMIAAPLKIIGVEAAPARVFLLDCAGC